MGIFGFLSKAHMDQGIPTGDVAAQISLLDEKINIQKELIKSERENIESARRALSQLDAQVSARLDRGTSEASAERSVQIRTAQRRDRQAYTKEIDEAQVRIEKSNATIQSLSLEKAPLATQYRKIEAEVGPIKYIAALIYGDNPDNATLERAVRWVIILLIFVFDPLALMLVIAAISSYKWEFDKKEEKPEIEPIAGYIPRSTDEKDESIIIEKVEEPKAGSIELTADGGFVEPKQDIPVKKKLSERLSQLKSKLPRLAQIKENLKKTNLNQFSRKLSSSLNQLNLKEKLSWKNLTDWKRSPILMMLKSLKSKKR
jgi:hypothetical protein